MAWVSLEQRPHMGGGAPPDPSQGRCLPCPRRSVSELRAQCWARPVQTAPAKRRPASQGEPRPVLAHTQQGWREASASVTCLAQGRSSRSVSWACAGEGCRRWASGDLHHPRRARKVLSHWGSGWRWGAVPSSLQRKTYVLCSGGLQSGARTDCFPRSMLGVLRK